MRGRIMHNVGEGYFDNTENDHKDFEDATMTLLL